MNIQLVCDKDPFTTEFAGNDLLDVSSKAVVASLLFKKCPILRAKSA